MNGKWLTSALKGGIATVELDFKPYSLSYNVSRVDVETSKKKPYSFFERHIYEVARLQASVVIDRERAERALCVAVMSDVFTTFKQIGREVISIDEEFGAV